MIPFQVMIRFQESVAIAPSAARWSRRRWLGTSALMFPFVRAQARSQDSAVRVLLVTGGHDHEPSFYSLFDSQEGMIVNVDPHPGAYRADFTSRYDVLVLYDMVQVDQIDGERRKNLQTFVESGKGLVVLHHAVCSYNQWEWWWRDVMGVRYLQKPEGNQPSSTYKHDEKLLVIADIHLGKARHFRKEGISIPARAHHPLRCARKTWKCCWLHDGYRGGTAGAGRCATHGARSVCAA